MVVRQVQLDPHDRVLTLRGEEQIKGIIEEQAKAGRGA